MSGRKGIRECPVFYPTAEEFGNFEAYVLSIEPQCLEHGICKVVPPAGWRPRGGRYEDKDDMLLNGPIRQEALGRAGTYQCLNVTQKPMTVGEYKKLARLPENQPPLDPGLTPEERAKEDFWQLEKKYWQGFSGKPPVYGADNFSASFFEDCAGAWCVRFTARVCSPRFLYARVPLRRARAPARAYTLGSHTATDSHEHVRIRHACTCVHSCMHACACLFVSVCWNSKLDCLCVVVCLGTYRSWTLCCVGASMRRFPASTLLICTWVCGVPRSPGMLKVCVYVYAYAYAYACVYAYVRVSVGVLCVLFRFSGP